MDHALKWLAAFLVIGPAFAQQDPEDALAGARDKLRAAGLSSYSCVETIDRSYFSRVEPSDAPESCERINLDRTKGHARMKLDSTDRLRLVTTMTQAREVYSLVGATPFSRDLDQLIHSGPLSSGALGSYLTEIFENPATRFEFLERDGRNLAYHFRVPIEASRFLVAAGSDWRAAGYDGVILVDPSTLDVVRLTLETDQLPPETSLCEVHATLEFHRERIGDADRPLALKPESHSLFRDTRETNNVTTFSRCGAPPSPLAADTSKPPVLPDGLTVKLALDQPIDSETSAAGDPISATLIEPVRDPETKKVLAPTGSRVTGRILRLQHQFDEPRGFVFSLAFDSIRIDGVEWPFNAQMEEPSAGGILVFPTKQPNYVIPAGFEMEWSTVGRVAK